MGVDRGMVKVHLQQFTYLQLSLNASTVIYFGNLLIDFMWLHLRTLSSRLAILGLTFQYTTARISRDTYDKYHSIYYDEVFRLNPLPPDVAANATDAITAISPDDLSVRAAEELRFMLFRHWTLYDAMYHSSYVAGKLGIWKERGRKRLTGLLAKMGCAFMNIFLVIAEPLPSFSIPQTQQPYAYMDLDLKHQLRAKLDSIAPEYGLVELTYPSFVRCFGYRASPLGAADAVEAVSALLDVAGGIRMEVEIEGARHGGEWFGGGRLWEGGRNRDEQREKLMEVSRKPRDGDGHVNEDGDADGEERKEGSWWVKNFWAAYDALSE
jgi:cell division control protein 45